MFISDKQWCKPPRRQGRHDMSPPFQTGGRVCMCLKFLPSQLALEETIKKNSDGMTRGRGSRTRKGQKGILLEFGWGFTP